MIDIASFLRARLDEIEHNSEHPDPTQLDRVSRAIAMEDTECGNESLYLERKDYYDEIAQVAIEAAGFDPNGQLADIAAKRKIIDLYAEHAEYDNPEDSYEHATGRICGLGEAVRLLALPYAGHPDYQEAWRP